jgi:hypothetical protein
MNPSIQRRTVLRAALATAAAGAWQAPTHAQTTWPAKPVNLDRAVSCRWRHRCLCAPPGGAVLQSHRQDAGHRQPRRRGRHAGRQRCGQGAGRRLHLFMGGAHHVVAPSMYPKLDYDIEKDFVPLIQLASVPQVLVVNPKRANTGQLQGVHRACDPQEPRQAQLRLGRRRLGRTTWRASCSSSRPRPSSPTSPTAAPARRCRT